MEPILSVEHLRRDYGGRGSVTHAVDDVSFSVERGEFVGIMGASGSGKSTLLNCIATIDTPTAGHIRVEGQDVTALKGRSLSRFRRERLGFVFQDCNLLDTLTAFENIALALTIRGTPAGEIEGRVKETAELLGITDCLNKYPYQMSGGQRQRVADVILEKADQRGGQKGKEEQRHRQREQQDAALQEGHKFISEQLTQFLLKFGWLFRFFVQSGFFGSFHQTFVAIGH